MKLFATIIAFLFATAALAQTTIIFEDGTTLTTDKAVYVSDTPLYRFAEAEPVAGEPRVDADGPPEVGTEAWCAWYVESVGGNITPTFDEEYRIYTRDC